MGRVLVRLGGVEPPAFSVSKKRSPAELKTHEWAGRQLLVRWRERPCHAPLDSPSAIAVLVVPPLGFEPRMSLCKSDALTTWLRGRIWCAQQATILHGLPHGGLSAACLPSSTMRAFVWCPRFDSNEHCPLFEGGDSCRWSTWADWCAASDSN